MDIFIRCFLTRIMRLILSELKDCQPIFAKRAEEEMDKLWDEGLWDQEKNEQVLHEHLRIPYEE